MSDSELENTENLQKFQEASGKVELAERMLVRLGYSLEEADKVIEKAIDLEHDLSYFITNSSSNYASYTHEEFAERCKDGFPIDAIVDWRTQIDFHTGFIFTYCDKIINCYGLIIINIQICYLKHRGVFITDRHKETVL